MAEKQSKWRIFTAGIIRENPVLRLVLGCCSALAVTTTVSGALGMGLAMTFVLVCSNIVISALRKVIPAKVHLPCYIVIIATFVTIVQMVLQAYVPALYKSLGVFLALIVVNCIILGRAEMFACKNSVVDSALDGLGMGCGYILTMLLMSSVREILGNGTWMGITIIPESIDRMSLMNQAPGGAKATEAVNAIMGTESASGPALHAVVNCNGGNGNCGTRFEYHGIPTCAAAAAIAGGPSACAFGCLGYGDCARACQFDAIHVVNGSAVVDREKCTGCSACVAACPHHVISLKPMAPQPAVLCSNKDKGPAVMKACKAGCIACGMCVRNCPQQAVTLVNNVAVIDYAKCSSCGTCVTKCPKKVIHWVDGQPAVAGEPA